MQLGHHRNNLSPRRELHPGRLTGPGLAAVGVAITSILALVSALLDNLDLAIGSPKAVEQGVVSGDTGECLLGISDSVADLGVVVACHQLAFASLYPRL